jgi:predicted ribosomally synthesized peptide with SipW-like signal peptide
MKKIIALVLACVLCVGIGIGGTLAWLTSTAKVTNTFNVGDVNITLTETNDEGKTVAERNYNFVPGDKLAKDPKVTVTDTSEDCWLFIHVDKQNNTVKDANDKDLEVLSCNIASGWIELEGHPGYYYRVVLKTADTKSFYVLAGDSTNETYANGYVTVSDAVTKDMVTTLKADPPKIVVTAAAIQKQNIADENVAWSKLPDDFKTGTTTTTTTTTATNSATDTETP